MREFDLGRLMEFSRHVPGNSPLHRLHPGAKLLLVGLAMTLLIAVRGTIVIGGACLILGVLTKIAGVPLRIPFRSLRRAAPWLLVVIIVQIFTVRGNDWGAIIAQFWIITIRGGQLYLAIESALRFSALILLLSLSIAVTETRELAYAVDALLRPLGLLRLPVRSLSLVMTIALYFVPLFAMEGDRMMKSQASRGADFEGKGFLGRIRVYFPIFVPLIVTALRHAENLARAMEARGLQLRGTRTRLVVHKLEFGSVIAVVAVLVVTVAAIGYPFPHLEGTIRNIF